MALRNWESLVRSNICILLVALSLFVILSSKASAQTSAPPVKHSDPPQDPPTVSSPEPSPSPEESPIPSPSGGTTSPPVPTSASVSITGTNSNTGSGNTNPPEVTSSGTTSTPPTGPLKYDTTGPCDQETVAYTYDPDPNEPGGVVTLGWYSGGDSYDDPASCGIAAGSGDMSGGYEPPLRGFFKEVVFGPDLREAIPGMSQFGMRCPQSFNAYKFMQLASDAMHAFAFLEGLILGGLGGEAEQATLAATTRVVAPRTVAREVCEEVTEEAAETIASQTVARQTIPAELRELFREIVGGNTGIDCSEIAEILGRSNSNLRIILVEGEERTLIQIPTINGSEGFYYHYVTTDGVSIFDPMLSGIPIPKDEYFRRLASLNNCRLKIGYEPLENGYLTPPTVGLGR